jgi:hypothetical protein
MDKHVLSAKIRSPMKYPHWQYFLLLESDLDATSRYVGFNMDNKDTYSPEFMKIILAAGAEIDVIAKKFVLKKIPTAKPLGKSECWTIDDYRHYITSFTTKFTSQKVLVPRYDLDFTPWASWAKSKNPEWWTAYNTVKHDRCSNYQSATLENTICALAGLMICNLYYHVEYLNDGLGVLPKLLETTNSPGCIMTEGWNPEEFA